LKNQVLIQNRTGQVSPIFKEILFKDVTIKGDVYRIKGMLIDVQSQLDYSYPYFPEVLLVQTKHGFVLIRNWEVIFWEKQ
jgi:hypothetical protein